MNDNERTIKRSFFVETDVDEVYTVVGELAESCKQLGLSGPKLEFNFALSAAEALANAMVHGNKSDPSKQVHVEFYAESDKVTLTISDMGQGFNVGTVPDPTLPENIEKSHGRGVHLIRSLADSVAYNDTGNQITFIIKF